jgi:fermentation-respiration switch protein FrsA (DUF1100 family)
LKQLLIFIALGYIGFVGYLYIFQDNIIFFPSTFDAYNPHDLQDINAIKVAEGELEWILLPAEQPSGKALVYFHGNAGTAIDRWQKAQPWREAGFDVVLAEYPGYGTNQTGRVGEKEFYEGGRVIVNKTRNIFPSSALYFYGESIGSGTAIKMASEYDEKAVIIEAGFSSLVDVAFSKYFYVPVHLLLRHKFDNVSIINQINSNLIIIHGDNDAIIPLKFGKKLFNAYEGPKKMHIINGAGHNDIYSKTNIAEIIKTIE